MCDTMKYWDRRIWVCVGCLALVSATLIVTTVHAQEPRAITGLPGPSLLEQWAQPSAVGMIIAIVALIVTLRENVKVIKEDLVECKGKLDLCITRREFDEFKAQRRNPNH